MTHPRSPHLAPGSAFLAGLLLVLLGLSAVLAYQAADAARSEARSTDRALRGYASFATWELARRADDVLHRRLAAVLRAALADSAPGMLSPESALEASGARGLAWCECARPVRAAFILRVEERPYVSVAGAAPGIERWLYDGASGSALRGIFASPADTTLVEAVTVEGVRYDLAA